MMILEGRGEYTARWRGSGNLGACARRLFMSMSVNDIPGEKRRRKPHRLAVDLAQARVEIAILPSGWRDPLFLQKSPSPAPATSPISQALLPPPFFSPESTAVARDGSVWIVQSLLECWFLL